MLTFWEYIYSWLLYLIDDWLLLYYIIIFFVSCHIFWLKVYFVWDRYDYAYFFSSFLFPGNIFSRLFYFEPIYACKAEMSPCRQHRVKSYFCNPSSHGGLLTGELDPFTFRVVIGMQGFTRATLSFDFWFLWLSIVSFSFCFCLCL